MKTLCMAPTLAKFAKAFCGFCVCVSPGGGVGGGCRSRYTKHTDFFLIFFSPSYYKNMTELAGEWSLPGGSIELGKLMCVCVCVCVYTVCYIYIYIYI